MRRFPILHLAIAVMFVISCGSPSSATAGGPVAAEPTSPASVDDDYPAGEPEAPVHYGAQVLAATGESISFEVSVPWEQLNLKPVTDGGKDYVRVSLPGWPSTAPAGAPLLPSLVEVIGVPFGATLSVQVETGPAHTVELLAPCLPAATQSIEESTPAGHGGVPLLPVPVLAVEEDPAVYSSGATYPGVLAEVTSDGVVRRQRVAGVTVHPVQYDPAPGKLTVYERLKVIVSFGGSLSAGAEPAPDSTAYETLFRKGLLNYEAARAWRQPVASASHLAGELMGASLPWAPPDPGWRVKVREKGFYKLTYAELQTAGVPVDDLDPRTFRLQHLGGEVAISVSGEADGSFDTGDHILFFCQPVSSKYAADNVYWLDYGQGTGLRMDSRSGAPSGAPAPDHYTAQHQMEDSAYYVQQAPGDDALERWFWDYLYTANQPAWSHTFSLTAPYTETHHPTLRVDLLGYLESPVYPDHHVVISLNGIDLGDDGDAWWDGKTWHTAEISMTQGVLLEGNNTLTITCPNDTGVGYDVVYIDRAELEFASNFTADGDELAFGYDKTGEWTFQVDGFSSDQLAVYDVTDPAGVVRIENIVVAPSGAGYVVSFQDDVAAPRAYWTTSQSRYRTAEAIEADTPSDLASPSNGADHIVIAHSAFWTEAGTLSDFRASQGLRAVRVDVQDVYDEFSYGLAEVEAIHDFLAYAYGNWQAPAPSFVVLVGDGHYDPKNHVHDRISYIHPYLAVADPWIIETAADNRYVTLAGDDAFPDMMLGRMAVNTSDEAGAFVDKILAYEQTPAPGDWQAQVLAVADNTDSGGDFAQASDDLLVGCLSEPYLAEKVYYEVTHSTVSDARAAIIAGINSGKLLVNYIGHGSPTLWASESLFGTADVDDLTNGDKTPVMLPMTCYDGFYHYPHPGDERDSVAEAVTRASGKGAVASWSPTGLGLLAGHDCLDWGFFEAVFQNGQSTLGQATNTGKLYLWASGDNLELLDTYLLFGDPALRLNVLPTMHDYYFPLLFKGNP